MRIEASTSTVFLKLNEELDLLFQCNNEPINSYGNAGTIWSVMYCSTNMDSNCSNNNSFIFKLTNYALQVDFSSKENRNVKPIIPIHSLRNSIKCTI